MPNTLLQSQIDYYQKRAAEYDEWFYRQGRYDRGEENNRQWHAEAAVLKQQLHEISRPANALEIACGTGIWTKELAPLCEKLTAFDAAETMLEINSSKTIAFNNINYVLADFFNWQPGKKFDLVFASFFISHIPKDMLAGVASKIGQLCAENGQVLLFDSLPEKTSSAVNHANETHGIQERKLNDGSSYHIIKEYYNRAEIEQAFSGFSQVQYGTTGRYFWYAHIRA